LQCDPEQISERAAEAWGELASIELTAINGEPPGVIPAKKKEKKDALPCAVDGSQSAFDAAISLASRLNTQAGERSAGRWFAEHGAALIEQGEPLDALIVAACGQGRCDAAAVRKILQGVS